MLLFLVFSAASDGGTAERQIQNRIFGQFVPVSGRIARQLCLDLDAVIAVC